MKFEITQIGSIHTPYKTKAECPVQGKIAPEGIGIVVVLPEYEAGLMDIESFSHIILIYIFDRAGEISLKRKPFLDDQEHGIFATRHPGRPNGIGMSIVKLLNKNKNILNVGEIDILDNTPLIDIKPYVPKFDFREHAGNGWVDLKEFREKPINRE